MDLKNIQWKEFLTQDFWFNIDRATLHLSDKLFLFAGIALVVLGIGFLFYARFAHNNFLARVALRISKLFLIVGLVEGFWYLLRIQFVQALGTHFVAALILLWAVVGLYWPLKYLLKNYKTDLEKAQLQARREEYLNRKK